MLMPTICTPPFNGLAEFLRFPDVEKRVDTAIAAPAYDSHEDQGSGRVTGVDSPGQLQSNENDPRQKTAQVHSKNHGQELGDFPLGFKDV